uniref:Uncharacterized protein n=1 Tax=Romanomermis culicivorax TaxID=13658 RepID=A0A915KSK0_ROMCU
MLRCPAHGIISRRQHPLCTARHRNLGLTRLANYLVGQIRELQQISNLECLAKLLNFTIENGQFVDENEETKLFLWWHKHTLFDAKFTKADKNQSIILGMFKYDNALH